MTKKKNKQPEINADLLSAVLADITNPETMRQCLLLLCNEKELLNLAKRLEILHELKLGNSYTDIQKKLTVSSATVSRMAQLSESDIARTVYKFVAASKWLQQKAQSTSDNLPKWLRRWI